MPEMSHYVDGFLSISVYAHGKSVCCLKYMHSFSHKGYNGKPVLPLCADLITYIIHQKSSDHYLATVVHY